MKSKNQRNNDGGMSRRRFLQRTAICTGAAALGFPALLRARGLNEKLNVGFIGLGAMGCGRLEEMRDCDAIVAAVCDADRLQAERAVKLLPENAAAPKVFADCRELIASDLDAVVIATPDHWHAPLATGGLKAGKHVFCEKPLTRTISEARDLRNLAKRFPQLATQMGNQGSASNNLRRAIEIIQAGAIGQVREVHVWVPASKSFVAGQGKPSGISPVPEGLNWDQWIGPAPLHAYKNGIYHPKAWRAWYDFGGGSIADWGCHGLNLPVRALKLGYPTAITPDVPGGYTFGYPKEVRLQFEFAARQELPPVTVWWYDGGRLPPESVLPKLVVAHHGEIPAGGVLILGDKGYTFGAPHPGAEYIQLDGEKKMSGLQNHAATKTIGESLPRSPGHLKEWIQACRNQGTTYSNFETGGALTETVLAGVVALRAQKPLIWDGEAMRATNDAKIEKFIRADYRAGWGA
jgi:predicted dehydrogenase